MKKLKILFAVFLLIYFAGCELIDPTEVENPSITDESLSEDPNGGAAPLITGLKYTFADAMGMMVVYTEVTSDNYRNTSTFISTIIDEPESITPGEQQLNDDRDIYFELQTLHAKALFGLKQILPADEEATDQDYAEVYFYKAMALIMLSENFWAFPIEEHGPVYTSDEALAVAIENLESSLALNDAPENEVRVQYALARAHRLAGNSQAAVQAAQAALALNPDYLFSAKYDEVNLENNVNVFTVTRQSTNDMQPLPSLDFLDPKYIDPDTDIPALKSEEAYLIIAEANLAAGNLQGAKQNMVFAVQAANNRPTAVYNDPDPREDLPAAADVKVKYGAGSNSVEGLVVARAGNEVQVYPVSHTHVTDLDINSLTDEKDLFRMLYLLRQEIFFLEGRRMSDLGIRLPVMRAQIDANENVVAGGPGTYVKVPSYIPADGGMDQFVYSEAENVITLQYDMNSVLAEHINEVSPFK